MIAAHEIEAYLHHGAKTRPMVQERYCIFHSDSTTYSLSKKDTIYSFVWMLSRVKEYFEIGLC